MDKAEPQSHHCWQLENEQDRHRGQGPHQRTDPRCQGRRLRGRHLHSRSPTWSPLSKMTKGTNIHVGAENVHFEKSGAFTGEISADMLTDLGVEYVVIGHSERRQYFAETNETVNKRTKAALAGGLKAIICVGESLDQREQGVTEELVRMQIKIALNGVTADELKNVVIAYEPIWAIGTGKTATADQAEEVCAAIRKVVGELYGEDVAKALTVQYGGSMNAEER